MKLAILAGSVITPEQEIPECTVLVEDSHIAAVGREINVPAGTRRVDARDKTCVPGFIDLHVHGAGGHDLMEGPLAAFEGVGRLLAVHGTTSYFPTTLTASVPGTVAALERLGAYVRLMGSPASDWQAQPLGIHMEGPFLNPVRKGVHPAEHIRKPSRELFDTFQRSGEGRPAPDNHCAGDGGGRTARRARR